MKKKTVQMTNNDIYGLCNSNDNIIEATKELSLPIKTMFFLQKNLKKITDAATEIDDARTLIIKKYGTLDKEKDIYTFDNIDEVNNEIKSLFDIVQDIEMYMIPLSSFGDINVSSQQMKVLLFMIDEEEE